MRRYLPGSDLVALLGFAGLPCLGESAPIGAIIFDVSIPSSPSSLGTYSYGGSPVPVSFSSDTGGLVANIIPNSLLATGTTYTINVNGVLDMAGNSLASPVTATFTTGSGDDLVDLTVTSSSPVNNSSGVADTTTSFSVTYSAPLDPKVMFGSASYVPQLTSNGVTVPTNFSFSSDRKTLTLTLQSGSLAAGTQYQIYLFSSYGYPYGAYDWAGNPLYPYVSWTITFTTQ
ncbi:MAG: hypothetical protein DMG32_17135 [Acidobacteria bacterium]|nr:MAG: hypothetical protein DMG32_17135 [Acidobacteriota bacterium]